MPWDEHFWHDADLERIDVDWIGRTVFSLVLSESYPEQPTAIQAWPVFEPLLRRQTEGVDRTGRHGRLPECGHRHPGGPQNHCIPERTVST